MQDFDLRWCLYFSSSEDLNTSFTTGGSHYLTHKSIEEENSLGVSDHSILNVSPLGPNTTHTELLHWFRYMCKEIMSTPGSCCISHNTAVGVRRRQVLVAPKLLKTTKCFLCYPGLGFTARVSINVWGNAGRTSCWELLQHWPDQRWDLLGNFFTTGMMQPNFKMSLITSSLS